MVTVGEMEAVLRQLGLLIEPECRGTRTEMPGEMMRWEARAETPGEMLRRDTRTETPGEMMRREARTEASGETMWQHTRPDPAQQVRWLTCDSREAAPGTVFICKGAGFREEYLQQAADQGSIAYISERRIHTRQNLPGFLVSDVRRAMAAASALFFGYVPGRPKLTGITGTKGKTTTAWYLKAMLDLWQEECGGPETGLISTVYNYDGRLREEAVMTTPEAPTLHALLSGARQTGLPYVTMEVSSQALKYRRVWGLQFDVGIFLNISEDHISPQEHEDFEDYFSSKLTIFRQTDTACVNLDADHADRILRAARKAKRIVTFGSSADADIRYSRVRFSRGRLSFQVDCNRFHKTFVLAMRGSFNIENAVAAIAAAYVYGVPVRCMQKALAQTRVPGRMEEFASRDGKICGIVDFAHNWLSFEKLYDAVSQEYRSYKNIITVFGCPGGKSYNRRRELGLAAGLFSDQVILTMDDPDREEPEMIADQIRHYAEMAGCVCRYEEDRREAVKRAVELARKSGEPSLILLLGRGCEKYQRIGGRLIACPTDSDLMREALEQYDAETATPCSVRSETASADSAFDEEHALHIAHAAQHAVGELPYKGILFMKIKKAADTTWMQDSDGVSRGAISVNY